MRWWWVRCAFDCTIHEWCESNVARNQCKAPNTNANNMNGRMREMLCEGTTHIHNEAQSSASLLAYSHVECFWPNASWSNRQNDRRFELAHGTVFGFIASSFCVFAFCGASIQPEPERAFTHPFEHIIKHSNLYEYNVCILILCFFKGAIFLAA